MEKLPQAPAQGCVCHPHGCGCPAQLGITTVIMTVPSGFYDAICGGHGIVLHASNHRECLSKDPTLKSTSVRPAFPEWACRKQDYRLTPGGTLDSLRDKDSP